jgi:hypothetical protein
MYNSEGFQYVHYLQTARVHLTITISDFFFIWNIYARKSDVVTANFT